MLDLLSCSAADRLLAAALGAAENGGASSSSQLASAMPPRYVDFKEQIRTEMFTIKQRMNDLRQIHGKAALTNFDDTDSSDAEIEVITQEITRLLRKCESRLQQFTAGPSESEVDEKVIKYQLAKQRSSRKKLAKAEGMLRDKGYPSMYHMLYLFIMGSYETACLSRRKISA